MLPFGKIGMVSSGVPGDPLSMSGGESQKLLCAGGRSFFELAAFPSKLFNQEVLLWKTY
jgi:hypothetical protein